MMMSKQLNPLALFIRLFPNISYMVSSHPPQSSHLNISKAWKQVGKSNLQCSARRLKNVLCDEHSGDKLSSGGRRFHISFQISLRNSSAGCNAGFDLCCSYADHPKRKKVGEGGEKGKDVYSHTPGSVHRSSHLSPTTF